MNVQLAALCDMAPFNCRTKGKICAAKVVSAMLKVEVELCIDKFIYLRKTSQHILVPCCVREIAWIPRDDLLPHPRT